MSVCLVSFKIDIESLLCIVSAYFTLVSFACWPHIVFAVVVLYALSAVYFAGVMVRLMLTLTPVVCVLSGVAFSRLLELYLKEEESPQVTESCSEDEGSGEGNSRNMYDKVQVILCWQSNT